MIVIRLRLARERVAVDAAGQARRPRCASSTTVGPEPEALPRLVEVRGEAPVHVEVAGRDGQVGRLERPAALLVDRRRGSPISADVVVEVLRSCRPAGRDRGRSTNAGPPTAQKTRWRPPKMTFRAGLRAWSVNSAGAGRDQLLDLGAGRGGRAASPGRPSRRPPPSRSIARSPRTSTPISARIRSEARWIVLDFVGRQDLERAERVRSVRQGSCGMPPPVRRTWRRWATGSRSRPGRSSPEGREHQRRAHPGADGFEPGAR